MPGKQSARQVGSGLLVGQTWYGEVVPSVIETVSPTL